ncbi:MAG: hypothetical protein HQL25_04220 [Candidatus Omnitrophica bacterium]|nr:hypothetical protein [Candidatus Omnitrophota bacterium]
MNRVFKKILASFLVIVFTISSFNISFAQVSPFMPVLGTMVQLSPAFTPALLKGIKVHADNPLKFEFILDRGDSSSQNDPERLKGAEGLPFKQESEKLIKYFLASLTVPEKDLWVNLSPIEKDRIVPDAFGKTEMGRDLLAQDYLLKQITASLIYPENDIGRQFWDKVYAEANQKFGTTDIPVDTFNKVWIVPEKAVVYENAKTDTAYIVETKLKVLLETDYFTMQKMKDSKSIPRTPDEGVPQKDPSPSQVQGEGKSLLAQEVLKAIVIPAIEKEVNEGKNFAQLRQVYNSLILATWYKKKIKDSILSQVYSDKNKIAGINIKDPKEAEKIWAKYVESFKKGAYNYIKEEYDPVNQTIIPRKYFSGGFGFAGSIKNALDIKKIGTMSSAMMSSLGRNSLRELIIAVSLMASSINGVIAQPQLTIVKESETKHANSNPDMFVEMKPIHLTLATFKDESLQLSNGFVVGVSNPEQQAALEKVFDKDILNYGISKTLLDEFGHIQSDEYENARKIWNFLKETCGLEVFHHEDVLDLFRLVKDSGVEEISRAIDQTVELFGKGFLTREGSAGVVRAIHLKGPESVGPIKNAFKNNFGNKADLVFFDKDFISFISNLSKEERKNVVNFIGMMNTNMSQPLLNYLFNIESENASKFIFKPSFNSLVYFLRYATTNDPERIFKILKVLSDEYKQSYSDQVDVLLGQPELAVFIIDTDIQSIRTVLISLLGEDVVDQLLPPNDLNAVRGLSQMPADFIKDPKGFLQKFTSDPKSLRPFFISWDSAKILLNDSYLNEIKGYNSTFGDLWKRVNAKFNKSGLIDGMIRNNPRSFFKLLKIVDNNGDEVIADELDAIITNIKDLYNANADQQQERLAAVRDLKPIMIPDNQDETTVAMRQANIRLRAYYMNSLFYMVSSKMIGKSQLSADKFKSLMLAYIVDTTPVRGLNNANSAGEVGMMLLKELKGEPELVLGVIAHEIGHNLFGSSEALADIWAFGFLSEIGHGDALEKLQEYLSYNNIKEDDKETHAVGRRAVKVLMEAVREFNDSQDVDWKNLARTLPDFNSYGIAEKDVFNVFVRYVSPKLNEEQKQYIANIDRLKAEKDLKKFAEDLKTLGDQAMNVTNADVLKTQDVFFKRAGHPMSQNLPVNKNTHSDYKEVIEKLERELPVRYPNKEFHWSTEGFEYSPSREEMKYDFNNGVVKKSVNVGWKVHLNVMPENVEFVSDYLLQNGHLFKFLHGGDANGETFTVYIGSFSFAKKWAKQISDDLRGRLAKPTRSDEVELAIGVVGRFSIDRFFGFGQYGRGGISFLTEEKKKYLWEKGPERQVRVEAAWRASFAVLLEKFGDYFYDGSWGQFPDNGTVANSSGNERVGVYVMPKNEQRPAGMVYISQTSKYTSRTVMGRVKGLIRSLTGADNAQKGGIDLNPITDTLQTKSSGEGIKFHMDAVMLEKLQNASGFVPVIISVLPLTDLKAFLE